jgi:hypothetical protein
MCAIESSKNNCDLTPIKEAQSLTQFSAVSIHSLAGADGCVYKGLTMNEFDLLTPIQKAWTIECWSCFPKFEHYAAAACAEGLADELWHLKEMAEDDEDFKGLFEEWAWFVSENHLWVLLEQSCDDGVMLPEALIYERVKQCPREWLAPFETLLKQCPDHVLAYLAQQFYLVVRMDRAERLGKADWQPLDGPFSNPVWEVSSWHKASFFPRKYAR